jgi:hypothetical protein
MARQHLRLRAARMERSPNAWAREWEKALTPEGSCTNALGQLGRGGALTPKVHHETGRGMNIEHPRAEAQEGASEYSSKGGRHRILKVQHDRVRSTNVCAQEREKH